jgi:hypothetical protein
MVQPSCCSTGSSSAQKSPKADSLTSDHSGSVADQAGAVRLQAAALQPAANGFVEKRAGGQAHQRQLRAAGAEERGARGRDHRAAGAQAEQAVAAGQGLKDEAGWGRQRRAAAPGAAGQGCSRRR